MNVLLVLSTFRAIYPKFKVKPNIVIFGKTLGNGYAVNAIFYVKKKIMTFLQKIHLLAVLFGRKELDQLQH